MQLPILLPDESLQSNLYGWKYYDRIVAVVIRFYTGKKRKKSAASASVDIYVPNNWKRIEKFEDLPEEAKLDLQDLTREYLENAEYWLSVDGFNSLVKTNKITKVGYEFLDDDQVLTSLGNSKFLMPEC